MYMVPLCTWSLCVLCVHSLLVYMVPLCTWSLCVHGPYVYVCMWFLCVHGPSVYIVLLCTWSLCVHGPSTRVYMVPLCTWSFYTCVHGPSVYMVPLCTWSFYTCVHGPSVYMVPLQALAQGIYEEFQNLIALYGHQSITNIMPLVVNVLESLDSSLADNKVCDRRGYIWVIHPLVWSKAKYT